MAGTSPSLNAAVRRMPWLSGTVPVLGLGMMMALWLLLRGVQAAFSGASLHVDEAQYWDWSRELHWGYHSKPPLVAALIAAGTRLFGDTEWAVRIGTMLCWPLAASACGALAVLLSGRAMAAAWAAAMVLASPWAGLLGLVATTDGPLVLAWALGLLALHGVLQRAGPIDGLCLAAALALGMLAKYTAAALWVGAWVLVLVRRRVSESMILVLASCAALLLLVPHLAWLSQSGWVTLRHTAEITAAASHAGSVKASPLTGLALALASVVVGIGPLALAAVAAWRPARHLAPGRVQDNRGLLLLSSLPLVVAGVAKAWAGGLQPNWLAPLLVPASVAMALAAVDGSRRFRQWLLVAMVTQTLIWLIAVSAPAMAQASGRLLPSALDPWSRMRGWQPALNEVARHLQGQPAVVLTESRSVIAQAAWHWRTGQGAPRLAFAPGPDPRHHYEGRCPWRLGEPRPTHLLLDAEPSAELRAAAGSMQRVARISHPLTLSRTLNLDLWRLEGAPPHGSHRALCR